MTSNQIPSTKVGSDQPTIDMTRVIWSINLSRWRAASVPIQIPTPMIGIIEKRASSSVGGKRLRSVSITGSLVVFE